MSKWFSYRRVEPISMGRVDPWINSPQVGGSTLLHLTKSNYTMHHVSFCLTELIEFFQRYHRLMITYLFLTDHNASGIQKKNKPWE